MMYPPILLFDFDGVVITQKALEYTALKLSRKRFYKFQNLENMRLIDFARLFEEADSKNRIKALIRWYKVYKRYIPSRWRRFFFFMKYRRTYPLYEKYETFKHDLKKVLVKLKANGFPLAIVSNTSEARLNFFRNKLDLDKYFSIYITRDDTPFRKPNPYPILLALKHIKMEYKVPIIKENVYFVGDLPTDIDTAKNAGINSIALLSGHGVKGDLEKSKPTFIIQDIKTILEIEPFKKFILD